MNAGVAPLLWGVGKVEEFEPHQQHWPAYEGRLTQYFVANGVTGVEVEGGSDTRKVAIFLTIIGPKTYGILRDLAAPAKPAEKSYAQLTKLLVDHFSPKPVLIAERFKFQQRNQQPSESISDYIAQLRKLTKHCRFKGPQLEDALRDRFVAGIRSSSIQRKLKDAIKIAQGMEAA